MAMLFLEMAALAYWIAADELFVEIIHLLTGVGYDFISSYLCFSTYQDFVLCRAGRYYSF